MKSCVTELSSHIDAESSGLNDALLGIENTEEPSSENGRE
jgi:hypothetical protein